METSQSRYFTPAVMIGAVILAVVVTSFSPNPVENFVPVLFIEFVLVSVVFIFKGVFLDTRWHLMEWLLTIVLATVPFGWSLQHRVFNKDTIIIGVVYAVLGFVLSALSSTLGLMQADRHKVTASFPRIGYIFSGWIMILGCMCAVVVVPFSVMKIMLGWRFDVSELTIAGLWGMTFLALAVGFWWRHKSKSVKSGLE